MLTCFRAFSARNKPLKKTNENGMYETNERVNKKGILRHSIKGETRLPERGFYWKNMGLKTLLYIGLKWKTDEHVMEVLSVQL